VKDAMLRIHKQAMHKLFSVKRVWFTTLVDDQRSDILRFMRIPNEMEAKYYIKNDIRYTVINDLTNSEDDLLTSMSRATKYDVVRSKKDGISIARFEGSELKNNRQPLERFKKAYLSFYEKTKIEDVIKAYSEEDLDSYVENNCMTLSIAQKDEFTVYHVHVHNAGKCMLLYSVSDFRNEHADKNILGRANKLLHFDDMLFFKSKEIKEYDWGDISSKENLNGIDKFKLSFGGKITDVYNIFVGKTLKGKLLVFLKKIMS